METGLRQDMLAVPSDVQEEVVGVLAWARALVIATPAEFEAAGEATKTVKRLSDRVLAFFAPHKDNAFKAHKALVSSEKDALAPLLEAETIAKSKMLVYQQAERAKAEAESWRLQAEADARAREERERLEAEAMLATPEQAKVLLEEAEAVVTPVAYVEPATPKVAGISTRRRWVAQVVNKAEFVAAAVANPNLLGYVQVDEGALAKTATMMKGEFVVPGVVFREVVDMAVRR